ncbi:TPA: hypothetical protein HA243_04550 [Candidatus Micrarchaeota archaeon]|nr:hypothetical protein [Candidatus Micrarchaeota archaeon]
MWAKTATIAIAFAGISIATAQTDSTQGAGWVPRNMASNLVNGFFLRCPLRPTEVTLLALMDEKIPTINAIGNYAAEIEGIRFGAGSVLSSTYTNGKLSRTADIRLAAGNKTFQFGVVFPFQFGDGIGPLPPSFHMGATTSNLRIGVGGSPFKSEKTPKSTYLSADVIFGNNAVSSTASWNGNDSKLKLVWGLEKKIDNTQIGVSVHPERKFLGGKTNPFISVRHIVEKSTILDLGYAPQQKRLLLGIGRRL